MQLLVQKVSRGLNDIKMGWCMRIGSFCSCQLLSLCFSIICSLLLETVGWAKMSFGLTPLSHSHFTTIPGCSFSNEFDSTAQESGRSTAMMKWLHLNLRDSGYLTFLLFPIM